MLYYFVLCIPKSLDTCGVFGNKLIYLVFCLVASIMIANICMIGIRLIDRWKWTRMLLLGKFDNGK